MTIIKTFEKKGGAAKVHVVELNYIGLRLMTENKDGYTDWPIWNDNAELYLYNFPERLPKYVKEDLVFQAREFLLEMQQ